MKTSHSASLVVKLEGENTINANTLIAMLENYVTISKRANQIVGQGEYQAEVNVTALKGGSFVINFEIATTWLQSLLSRENLTYAAGLVGGISGALEIYRYFKGRKATKEQINAVINIKNEVAYHIYDDQTTRESFRNSFEAMNKDVAVSGLTVTANGKKGETIPEAEFENLIEPIGDIKVENRVIIDKRAHLTIVSLGFNRGDNWKCLYLCQKIQARQDDDSFQETIDRGEVFGKGDALLAELEITQRWDEASNVFVDYKYRVIHVIEHIRRPKQTNLFAGDECNGGQGKE